jgi:hypothetical protein
MSQNFLKLISVLADFGERGTEEFELMLPSMASPMF